MNKHREAQDEPTVAFLRERAAYHRARAIRALNPTTAAEYLDITEIIERAANAQHAEEAALSQMKRSA
jgi:hypothetical protein